MKQHITPQDLDQLTPEGKEKLRAWWTPAEGDICWSRSPTAYPEEDRHIDVLAFHDRDCCGGDQCDYDRERDGLLMSKSGYLPLLTIGQIIQLIEDLELEVTHYHHGTGFKTITWDNKQELLDSLWTAVVDELNKEIVAEKIEVITTLKMDSNDLCHNWWFARAMVGEKYLECSAVDPGDALRGLADSVEEELEALQKTK